VRKSGKRKAESGNRRQKNLSLLKAKAGKRAGRKIGGRKMAGRKMPIRDVRQKLSANSAAERPWVESLPA